MSCGYIFLFRLYSSSKVDLSYAIGINGILCIHNTIEMYLGISVISREIRPLAALYPPPHTKTALKTLYKNLSVVAGGGMLIPTAFDFKGNYQNIKCY